MHSVIFASIKKTLKATEILILLLIILQIKEYFVRSRLIVRGISNFALNFGAATSPTPFSSLFHQSFCSCHLLPILFLLSLFLFLTFTIKYLILNVCASLILVPHGLITNFLCKLRVHSCGWSLYVEVHQ